MSSITLSLKNTKKCDPVTSDLAHINNLGLLTCVIDMGYKTVTHIITHIETVMHFKTDEID